MKTTLKILAALALAGVLLWLTFDLEDAQGNAIAPSAVLGYLGEARPAYLVAGMMLGVVHLLVRSLRWRTLLVPVRPRVPVYPLLATTSLGYAASLLGGRVGEVLRPALLGLRESLPVPSAIGTVVVERFLDLVAIVVLASLAVLAPPRLSGLVVGGEHLALFRSAGAAALVVGLGALAVMAVLSSRRESLEAWADARSAVKPRSLRGRGLRLLSRFLHGADALRRPALLLSAGVQSLGVWLVIGCGVWLLLLGCGVDIPLAGAFILVPALALGIAVPTPGGAGGYHLAMRTTLEKLFGVEPAVAVSASLLHHAATWMPMIVVAAAVMARDGLGFRDLSRAILAARGSAR